VARKSLDAIPKTHNGKVQRSSMATLLELTQDSSSASSRTDGQGTAPKTDLETQLSKIWCDELGIENVGRNDDFFFLGGDSLTAVRMSLRVLDEFDLNISLRQIFEAPTVADLAAMIDEKKLAIDPENDFGTDEPIVDEREGECTIAQIGILDCVQRYSGLRLISRRKIGV